MDKELKKYIMDCAKEHCVERMDNPLKELPHKVKPDLFYHNQVKQYKKELKWLKSLTDEQAKKEEIKWRLKQQTDFDKFIKKESMKNRKVEKIYDKVKAWKSPASLLMIKDYMIHSLERGMSKYERYSKWQPNIDFECSGKEWKNKRIHIIKELIVDNEKRNQREKEWVKNVNSLLKDLKDAIGDW